MVLHVTNAYLQNHKQTFGNLKEKNSRGKKGKETDFELKT